MRKLAIEYADIYSAITRRGRDYSQDPSVPFLDLEDGNVLWAFEDDEEAGKWWSNNDENTEKRIELALSEPGMYFEVPAMDGPRSDSAINAAIEEFIETMRKRGIEIELL